MRLKGGFSLNTLGIAHGLLTWCVPQGGFCIDATAGRGRDTELLCRLVGADGRVLAMDIQPEAVSATTELLREQGLLDRARVVCDSHSNMGCYAEPESADCIVFNLGWLPGGDHSIYTIAQTSLQAIGQGLELLKPGGVMSISSYYGGSNGTEERDAVLGYLAAMDSKRFTVLCGRWLNRSGNPAIPIAIFKE